MTTKMSISGNEEKGHFSHLFHLWSSKAKAIVESRNQSEKIKEQVEEVTKNLKELEKSLNLVSTWDECSKALFQRLHQTANEIFEHLHLQEEQPPTVDNPTSSNEPHPKIQDISRRIREIRRQARPFLELLPERLNSDETDETIIPTVWNRLDSEEETLTSLSMADVRSTYDDLDSQLKLCFLSLSIFPEDSIIRKRSLIYLWIGEGFVDGEEVEKIGENCFKKLWESGLIVPLYDKQSRSPHSCKLDPWIRWMAITIAKETMFFDFNIDGQPCSGASECPRRACVSKTDKRRAEEVDLKLQDPDSTDLRSLFNIDVRFLECLEEDFKKHKNMTTLQLGRWKNSPEYHIEVINSTFLNHLGHLKRLRYLGLQGVSRITDLPESIKDMSEMRVLDLRACHNLEKLPSGITSLKKLTHLDVTECYLLEYMPKGLGSLTNLEFLDGFVVSNLKNQEACKLSELDKLKKLRKLSISFGVQEEGVTNADWEELEALQNITGLHSLTITWGRVLSSSDDQKNKDGDQKTKKAPMRALSRLTRRQSTLSKPRSSKISLKLPPNLEKLDLRCFPKEEAPELLWAQAAETPRGGSKNEAQDQLQKGDKQRKSREPDLKKLYFRGRSLCNCSTLCGGSKEAPAAELSTPKLLSGGRSKAAAPELIEGKGEPSLKKLYFRGGNLCILNGIEDGGQVSQVQTVRLRFLKNLKITRSELEKMFPTLKYAEFYKCKEIFKTSFASDDEASTSNVPVATSRSSVVYKITEDDRKPVSSA